MAEKINNNVVVGEESKRARSREKNKEQHNEEESLYETTPDSFEKQIHVFSKKTPRSIFQADVPHQKEDNSIRSALNEARQRLEVDEEEQLIQAYQQQMAKEEANAIKKKIKKKLKEQMSNFTSHVQSHEVVLNNEVGKKKEKKKEVPVMSEPEMRYGGK